MDKKIDMKDVQECGQRLLDVAIEYNELANRAGIYGAVIWLTGTDGELVIVTRGECRERLLDNIERTGPTVHFGHTVDDNA